MLEQHANVVQFVALAGEVVGRKKLQKMVYIAKKLDYPFNEKYHFHMYGPYSEELTLRVEELCTMGFLTERKEDKGAYQQYRYAVTTEGASFTNSFARTKMDASPIVDALNAQSSRFLELVSTLLYFDELSRDEQVAKLRVVKAKLNFTDEEIERAFQFIGELQQFKNQARRV